MQQHTAIRTDSTQRHKTVPPDEEVVLEFGVSLRGRIIPIGHACATISCASLHAFRSSSGIRQTRDGLRLENDPSRRIDGLFNIKTNNYLFTVSIGDICSPTCLRRCHAASST